MTDDPGSRSPLAALVARLQKQPHEPPCLARRGVACICWIGRAVEFLEAEAALGLAGREPQAPELIKLLQQIRCTHPQRTGGNDYIMCPDCNLWWDYRRETADDVLLKKLAEGRAGRPAAPPEQEA